MARRGYPPEFRQRVIEVVEGGRKVAEVAILAKLQPGSGDGGDRSLPAR